jgi:hypothetical protein
MASRPFAICLCAILLALLGGVSTTPPVWAASSSLYEVDNVAVDATAQSAAVARTEALAAGEREAFHRLVRRLTLQKYHDRLPNPDQATISTYVRDFSVSDEKTSSVRYLAKMHVRFRSTDIRQLLAEFGIPFTETISKPVLVIPVFERNGSYSLWEETNDWRSLWNQVRNDDRMAPMMHPIGDLTDISAIGAQHAVSGDAARLRAMSERYGTGSVLVVHAILNTSIANVNGLEVYVTPYGPASGGQTRVSTYTGPVTETIRSLLSNAVADIAKSLDDAWKRENVMHIGDRGVLPVSIPIPDLPGWLKIQNRITQAAVVNQMEVVLLSRQEARINLHYLGDLHQLQVALAQKDLQLVQIEGAWVIHGNQ